MPLGNNNKLQLTIRLKLRRRALNRVAIATKELVMVLRAVTQAIPVLTAAVTMKVDVPLVTDNTITMKIA